MQRQNVFNQYHAGSERRNHATSNNKCAVVLKNMLKHNRCCVWQQSAVLAQAYADALRHWFPSSSRDADLQTVTPACNLSKIFAVRKQVFKVG